MIHHEPWFTKHAIREDLRQLQERARHGDPDAIIELRRLQERTSQPIEGEDEATTLEDVRKLIRQSFESNQAYFPLLTKSPRWIATHLDENALDEWVAYTSSFAHHPDVKHWYMNAMDEDPRVLDYFMEWEPLEFIETVAKRINDAPTLAWLFRHGPKEHFFPNPDLFQRDLIHQVPKASQPTVDFEEIEWRQAKRGSLPLSDFLKRFEGYRWENIDSSRYAWKLVNPPMETSQGVVQHKEVRLHEDLDFIRWVAKIMEPEKVRWP